VTELWVGVAPTGGSTPCEAGLPVLLPLGGPVRLTLADPSAHDPVATPARLDAALRERGRRLDAVVAALPPDALLLDGRPLERGTAAHRRAEWIERADAVVLLPGADRRWLEWLQPGAAVIRPGDNSPRTWDAHRNDRRAGWVRALNGDPAWTEREARAIVLTARRPLHPGRALAWLLGDWPGVWRARGFAWTVDRPDVVAEVDRIGPHADLRAAGAWWVATARRHWPVDPGRLARLRADWDADFGDRVVQIALLGEPAAMDPVRAGFAEALVRDEELDPEWTGAALRPDPFGTEGDR
jgi:hypothetical protein